MCRPCPARLWLPRHMASGGPCWARSTSAKFTPQTLLFAQAKSRHTRGLPEHTGACTTYYIHTYYAVSTPITIRDRADGVCRRRLQPPSIQHVLRQRAAANRGSRHRSPTATHRLPPSMRRQCQTSFPTPTFRARRSATSTRSPKVFLSACFLPGRNAALSGRPFYRASFAPPRAGKRKAKAAQKSAKN